MQELQQRFGKGDLVAGHYLVLGIAGAGGMGVVYPRAARLRAYSIRSRSRTCHGRGR